jgi:hypothetical protein
LVDTVIGGKLYRLDADLEASGPHDFAVREKQRLVSAPPRVHRIPPPTSVTIAKRPSVWDGTSTDMRLIWVF